MQPDVVDVVFQTEVFCDEVGGAELTVDLSRAQVALEADNTAEGATATTSGTTSGAV